MARKDSKLSEREDLHSSVSSAICPPPGEWGGFLFNFKKGILLPKISLRKVQKSLHGTFDLSLICLASRRNYTL